MTAHPLFDLSGRRALVTGAGGGIGSAIATALAGAGARVAALGRSETVHEVGATVGGPAIIADLVDRAELRRGFDEAVVALGGLDILVTAHGVAHPSAGTRCRSRRLGRHARGEPDVGLRAVPASRDA